MLPQANSWEIADRPMWPQPDAPPATPDAPPATPAASAVPAAPDVPGLSTVDDGGAATGGPATATPVPRVAAAVRGQRPAVPTERTVVPAADRHRTPAGAAPPADTRPRSAPSLRIGQVAGWQVALTLIGLSVGRPWPVAGPAAVGAAILLALTGLRWRRRWLYQWAVRALRFRTRARRRHLPREDGLRALLHLFAPDATMTSIRLDDGDTAVVSRVCGATAVLRPRLAGGDPVEALPRPGELLHGGDEPALAVQTVFHGLAGNRRRPLGWIAVRAVRTPALSEEDEILPALRDAVQRVLSRLADREVRVAGLGQATLLATLASLAHVSDDRGEVRERWRCWSCGPIAQAGFRLGGWAALPEAESRRLLRRLLTATTGAVVTVAVTAGGAPGPEAATMRVAAPGVEQLERSVAALAALAAEQDVRLDRMDGEHVDGVAASLPLGGLR